ncbi:MAG: L,D-transpeptidase [Proteobacteria bacterium]|nr:L,D-transpeptidase [Pseudomonadota bacterium]
MAIVLASLPGHSQKREPSRADAGVDTPKSTKFPLLMRTRRGRGAVVYRAMHKRSARLARIYHGSVLRVRRRGRSPGCPSGWMERQGRGFICSKHLKSTKEQEAHPSPIDDPNVLSGLNAVKVTRNRTLLYRRLKDIDRRLPNTTLRAGSTLIVREKISRRGNPYFETRRGWYVEAEHTEKLPPPIKSLGVILKNGDSVPAAIVILPNTRVFTSPGEENGSLSTLKRWTTISRSGDAPLSVDDGWVKLSEGQYVNDDNLARFRPAPRPRRLGPGERWIAIDIEEQLFHTYEGEQLVRIIPCSTGRRSNTKRGRYRIQWKRRMQTMRLRRGHERVEDVQWVMYYDRRKDIAIHSAYWHSNFGKPVSHGCVNLPPGDAKWVFEWSSPHALPEDSERFPSPGEPGTQVIVF